MHTQAVHDAYIADIDAGGDPDADSVAYPTTTTFYNNQIVAGIIEVDSPQVITSDVTIRDAQKEMYEEATFATLALQADLVVANAPQAGVTDLNRASAASFYYLENQIPLDTTYWVKYQATVEVSYDLGIRRLLLELEFDHEGRQILQADASESQDEDAEATAIVLDGPLADMEDERDGAVLLAANSCQDAEELAIAMPYVVGSFLRIAESRVQAVVEKYTDSMCFVQVTLKHSDCADLVAISDLLEDLDIGVTEIAGKFHDEVAEHADIPTGTQFDRDVFYVIQSPTEDPTVFTIGEDEDTDITTGQEFDAMTIVYALIFLLIGAVGATIIHKMTNKKQDKTVETVNEVDTLMAQRDMVRRSSMSLATSPEDIQVTVHNA